MLYMSYRTDCLGSWAPNPADHFASQFGGSGFHPPTESMNRVSQAARPQSTQSGSSGGGGQSVGPTQSGGSSSGGGSATVQVSYAPVFHFEGVPADAQKFLRDVMEPAIVNDLKNNTRGLTSGVISALDKWSGKHG